MIIIPSSCLSPYPSIHPSKCPDCRNIIKDSHWSAPIQKSSPFYLEGSEVGPSWSTLDKSMLAVPSRLPFHLSRNVNQREHTLGQTALQYEVKQPFVLLKFIGMCWKIAVDIFASHQGLSMIIVIFLKRCRVTSLLNWLAPSLSL